MLYTKPINEITYQDVVGFCSEGHSEGFILEYKHDFTSLSNEKLAKTVAAFANTYGGILVIGIDAPSGKPVAPFEGFAIDPSIKYEEKIESVILAHIKEPIFPEVRVCEPMNGKTFIVIRVVESHLTPHRVADNTKIYVRTGQSSTPNAEATWDKIEWLASRRKKSEEFRKLLIDEGDRYFQDACRMRGINLEDRNHYFVILSIRIIPLFPQEPLIPFKNLDKIKNEITVCDKFGGSFPNNLYESDAIQNGVRKLFVMGYDKKEPAHGKAFKYFHFNSYGMYLYKEDIGELGEQPSQKDGESESEPKIKKMYFNNLSYKLCQFLASANLFYQKLGYWGSIQIEVELTNALGVRMPHPLKNIIFEVYEDLLVPSDNLKWERITPYTILKERTRDVMMEMIDAIAWSLGVRDFTEERIRKHLEDIYGK